MFVRTTQTYPTFSMLLCALVSPTTQVVFYLRGAWEDDLIFHCHSISVEMRKTGEADNWI